MLTPESTGRESLSSADEQVRATPEQRRQLKEIVHWLKSDLFERVPPDVVLASDLNENPKTMMVWRSPLKWVVLLSLRRDGTGLAGEVRAPDGSAVSTTSFVEIFWLEEKLP